MAERKQRTFPEIDALVKSGKRPFDGVEAVRFENHLAGEIDLKLERHGAVLLIKVVPGRTPSGLIRHS